MAEGVGGRDDLSYLDRRDMTRVSGHMSGVDEPLLDAGDVVRSRIVELALKRWSECYGMSGTAEGMDVGEDSGDMPVPDDVGEDLQVVYEEPVNMCTADPASTSDLNAVDVSFCNGGSDVAPLEPLPSSSVPTEYSSAVLEADADERKSPRKLKVLQNGKRKQSRGGDDERVLKRGKANEQNDSSGFVDVESGPTSLIGGVVTGSSREKLVLEWMASNFPHKKRLGGGKGSAQWVSGSRKRKLQASGGQGKCLYFGEVRPEEDEDKEQVSEQKGGESNGEGVQPTLRDSGATDSDRVVHEHPIMALESGEHTDKIIDEFIVRGAGSTRAGEIDALPSLPPCPPEPLMVRGISFSPVTAAPSTSAPNAGVPVFDLTEDSTTHGAEPLVQENRSDPPENICPGLVNKGVVVAHIFPSGWTLLRVLLPKALAIPSWPFVVPQAKPSSDQLLEGTPRQGESAPSSHNSGSEGQGVRAHDCDDHGAAEWERLISPTGVDFTYGVRGVVSSAVSSGVDSGDVLESKRIYYRLQLILDSAARGHEQREVRDKGRSGKNRYRERHGVSPNISVDVRGENTVGGPSLPSSARRSVGRKRICKENCTEVEGKVSAARKDAPAVQCEGLSQTLQGKNPWTPVSSDANRHSNECSSSIDNSTCHVAACLGTARVLARNLDPNLAIGSVYLLSEKKAENDPPVAYHLRNVITSDHYELAAPQQDICWTMRDHLAGLARYSDVRVASESSVVRQTSFLGVKFHRVDMLDNSLLKESPVYVPIAEKVGQGDSNSGRVCYLSGEKGANVIGAFSEVKLKCEEDGLLVVPATMQQSWILVKCQDIRCMVTVSVPNMGDAVSVNS